MAGTREDFLKTVFLELFFASHKLILWINLCFKKYIYVCNIICMVKVTVETLWPPRHHIIKKQNNFNENIMALMWLARFLSQKCKGANRIIALIINEVEKKLMSSSTFSKRKRDWPSIFNDGLRLIFNFNKNISFLLLAINTGS